MECVNLKERFGDRFRVTYEESYEADHGDGARAEDPWLQIIPCFNGHIYVHGGDELGASTNRRGPITNRLMGLDCTTVVQDADDGVNVIFKVDDFDEVAKVMRPHRHRQWTAEQREAQRQIYIDRFQPKVSCPETALETHPAGLDGSEDPKAAPVALEAAETGV